MPPPSPLKKPSVTVRFEIVTSEVVSTSSTRKLAPSPCSVTSAISPGPVIVMGDSIWGRVLPNATVPIAVIEIRSDPLPAEQAPSVSSKFAAWIASRRVHCDPEVSAGGGAAIVAAPGGGGGKNKKDHDQPGGGRGG